MLWKSSRFFFCLSFFVFVILQNTTCVDKKKNSVFFLIFFFTSDRPTCGLWPSQWHRCNHTLSVIGSTVKSYPHLIFVNRGSCACAISSFQSWDSVEFEIPPNPLPHLLTQLSTTSLAAHAASVSAVVLVKSRCRLIEGDHDSAFLGTLQMFQHTLSGRL